MRDDRADYAEAGDLRYLLRMALVEITAVKEALQGADVPMAMALLTNLEQFLRGERG